MRRRSFLISNQLRRPSSLCLLLAVPLSLLVRHAYTASSQAILLTLWHCNWSQACSHLSSTLSNTPPNSHSPPHPPSMRTTLSRSSTPAASSGASPRPTFPTRSGTSICSSPRRYSAASAAWSSGCSRRRWRYWWASRPSMDSSRVRLWAWLRHVLWRSVSRARSGRGLGCCIQLSVFREWPLFQFFSFFLPSSFLELFCFHPGPWRWGGEARLEITRSCALHLCFDSPVYFAFPRYDADVPDASASASSDSVAWRTRMGFGVRGGERSHSLPSLYFTRSQLEGEWNLPSTFPFLRSRSLHSSPFHRRGRKDYRPRPSPPLSFLIHLTLPYTPWAQLPNHEPSLTLLSFPLFPERSRSLIGGPIAGALLTHEHGSYAGTILFAGINVVVGSFFILACKLVLKRELFARVWALRTELSSSVPSYAILKWQANRYQKREVQVFWEHDEGCRLEGGRLEVVDGRVEVTLRKGVGWSEEKES